MEGSIVVGAHEAAPRRYGYDAVEDRKRRMPPLVVLQSEDRELSADGRRKLVATARDLPRNYEVAAWMVRKHLDYVTSFNFKAATGVEPFDTQLEEWVARASRPAAFDAAGRHSRESFLRLAEARRVIDGDFGVLRLADGRVQGIEGDRIRRPGFGEAPLGLDPDRIVHGVLCDEAGRATAYAVFRREGSGFAFDRMVPAGNFYLHAYWERIDQVRGVSPLAAAINRLRDTYEAFDYALAKAKLEQMMAVALYRHPEETEAVGDVQAPAGPSGAPSKAGATLTLPGAAAIFDFSVGEKAEFLESQHPSTQFKDFSQMMIAVALLALDIPYVFFDATLANFTVSRSARLLYEQSCEPKQQANRDLLDWWFRWRLSLAVLDGEIRLPAGTRVEDVRCEWIARAVPWVQPREEAEAAALAVERGFTSTPRVCKRAGDDAYAIVDEEAEYQRYRRAKLAAAASEAPAP